MRLKLISCEIFYREMCWAVARSPNQVDIEFAAQHGRGETHGHLAIEIVLLALEQRMRLEPDHEQRRR